MLNNVKCSLPHLRFFFYFFGIHNIKPIECDAKMCGALSSCLCSACVCLFVVISVSVCLNAIIQCTSISGANWALDQKVLHNVKVKPKVCILFICVHQMWNGACVCMAKFK